MTIERRRSRRRILRFSAVLFLGLELFDSKIIMKIVNQIKNNICLSVLKKKIEVNWIH